MGSDITTTGTALERSIYSNRRSCSHCTLSITAWLTDCLMTPAGRSVATRRYWSLSSFAISHCSRCANCTPY